MYRSFLERPVASADVEEIIAAALRAPSAGFSQGVELLVITESSQRRRFFDAVTTPGWLAATTTHRGLDMAPVVIVPLFDKARYLQRYSESDKRSSSWSEESSWPVPYWLVDCSFAAMLMLARVVDLGLGALFFAIDRGEDILYDEFQIPSQLGFLGAIAIGYPASSQPVGSATRRPRRPLGEVVHRERYGS
jgi:nitroreductase